MTRYDQLYREVSKLICLTLGGFIERRLSKLKGDKYMNVIYNTCMAERNKRKYPIQNANTSANNNNRKGNSSNPAIQNIISLCNKSGGALNINPSVDFDVSMATYIICSSPLRQDLFDGLFNEYEEYDFTHAIIRIKDEFRPTGSHPNVRIYDDEDEVLSSVMVGKTQLKFIHNMLLPKKVIWSDQSDPFIETVIQKRMTIEQQNQQATYRDEQKIPAEKAPVIDATQIASIVRDEIRNIMHESPVSETVKKESHKAAVSEPAQNRDKTTTHHEPAAEQKKTCLGCERILPSGNTAEEDPSPFCPECRKIIKENFEKGHELWKAENYPDAIKCFQKSGERGDADSQYQVGKAYYYGLGIPADYTHAYRWLKMAADKEIPDACYLIGKMNELGVLSGKNPDEAFRYYKKAVELGHKPAQFSLGECYYYGRGVSRDIFEAKKWFSLSAEGNNPHARYYLGMCYLQGEGTAKDPAEAVRWLKKASKSHLPDAQYQLGLCFQQGIGIEKNEKSAITCFQKAAEKSYSPAKIKLASCYYDGIGVPMNYQKAIALLREIKDNEREFQQAQDMLKKWVLNPD